MKRYVILMTVSLLSTVSIANAMEKQEEAWSPIARQSDTRIQKENSSIFARKQRILPQSKLRVSSKPEPKVKVKKRQTSLDTIDGLRPGKKSAVPFLHGAELPDDAPRLHFRPMETIKEE